MKEPRGGKPGREKACVGPNDTSVNLHKAFKLTPHAVGLIYSLVAVSLLYGIFENFKRAQQHCVTR